MICQEHNYPLKRYTVRELSEYSGRLAAAGTSFGFILCASCFRMMATVT